MRTPFIEQEIREQPEVLRRVLQRTKPALDELVVPARFRRVHLVGCGDMVFAADVVAWFARLHLQVEVLAWRSMDLRWIAGRLGADDLVLVASISGRTHRTIEAARRSRRAGARVLGITDNPDAPLSEEVDGVVALQTSPPEALRSGPYPGYHHQIAQTKTYTAVLLVELAAVVRASGAPDPGLASIPDAVEDIIPRVLATTQRDAPEWFSGRDRVSVLGSGPSRGTAHYGAAKLLEYAVPAHAQCLEEFNHLEMFLADGRTLCLVLAPDESARSRVAELLEAWERLDARSVVVGPAAELPGCRTGVLELPSTTPVVEPFLQAVALQALAFRGAVALGRDPDRWLGGVRTERIQEASQATVRGSKIL